MNKISNNCGLLYDKFGNTIAEVRNLSDVEFIVRAINSLEENEKKIANQQKVIEVYRTDNEKIRNSYGALLEAAKGAKKAVSELFKELGKKEAGRWDIINDNFVALDKAIAQAEARI